MSKILIVEDNPRLSRLMQLNLEAEGYQVTLHSDGIQASDYLREHSPDLVILDLMLLTLSGWEILEQMRRDPRLDRIPTVIISAMARPEDRQRALSMGASEYFLKPFVVRDLLTSVNSLLQDVSHA
jgi:DNA-binding response OmpR family regulator